MESTIGLFKTELIDRQGAGPAAPRSSGRPPPGCTGTTRASCTPRSATPRPPSSNSTTVTPPQKPPRPSRWPQPGLRQSQDGSACLAVGPDKALLPSLLVRSRRLTIRAVATWAAFRPACRATTSASRAAWSGTAPGRATTKAPRPCSGGDQAFAAQDRLCLADRVQAVDVVLVLQGRDAWQGSADGPRPRRQPTPKVVRDLSVPGCLHGHTRPKTSGPLKE